MSESKISMGSLPKFKGEVNDFSRYSAQFKSFAEIVGVGSALRGTLADLPSSDDEDLSTMTEADRKKAELALMANRKAVAMLTLSLDANKLLAILEKGKNSAFPDGRADLIWQELHKKYQPKDGLSRVEMLQKLFDMEWGESQDPNEIFDGVLELESRYAKPGKEMSEDLKMAALINKAPKKYYSAIVAEEQAKGDALSLDDVQKAVDKMWRLYKRGSKGEDDTNDDPKETETALGSIVFRGKCHYCHETGHKKWHCPKLKAERKFKFDGQCGKCGGKGHKEYNCPSETSNVAVVEGETELLI